MPEPELHGVSRGRYLPQIDALRGLAVVGVFLFHLYTSAWPKAQLEPLKMWADLRSQPGIAHWIGAPSLFGYAGVPLFFVISGFCIHLSFLQDPRPFAYWPFMGRRFWRIYPAYLVAIGLSLLLPGNLIWQTHHVPKSVLLHLLFLHNVDHTTVYELSPPFWTLAVEFQFYAAYPIFLLLRRWFGAMTAVVIVLALAVALSLAWHGSHSGFASPPALRPALFWPEWCLGALIAERFTAGKPPLLRFWIAAPVALAGILLAVPIDLWIEWNYLAWAILSAALIERSVRTPSPLLTSRFSLFRPLVWIGAISYSIYLLHAMMILQLLPRMPRSADVRFLFGIVAIFPLVIVASVFSYLLVEMPGIAIGRRVLSWWFRTSSTGR